MRSFRVDAFSVATSPQCRVDAIRRGAEPAPMRSNHNRPDSGLQKYSVGCTTPTADNKTRCARIHCPADCDQGLPHPLGMKAHLPACRPDRTKNVGAAMDEAGKSAWCRQHSVYPGELDKWRANCTAALAEPEEARAARRPHGKTGNASRSWSANCCARTRHWPDAGATDGLECSACVARMANADERPQ